jgi:hypothetical protein
VIASRSIGAGAPAGRLAARLRRGARVPSSATSAFMTASSGPGVATGSGSEGATGSGCGSTGSVGFDSTTGARVDLARDLRGRDSTAAASDVVVRPGTSPVSCGGVTTGISGGAEGAGTDTAGVEATGAAAAAGGPAGRETARRRRGALEVSLGESVGGTSTVTSSMSAPFTGTGSRRRNRRRGSGGCPVATHEVFWPDGRHQTGRRGQSPGEPGARRGHAAKQCPSLVDVWMKSCRWPVSHSHRHHSAGSRQSIRRAGP